MGLPYNFVFLFYLIFLADGSNIEGLMLTSVVAASTQFLIQVPAIRHQGYRYRLDINLKDPYLKKALILVIPVMLGTAVQQVNTIIDRTLASSLVEGSISALTYASRLKDLIISVFVTAITTVVFPMLAKSFSQQDGRQVKRILEQGINLILLITVPATVGIIILAEPIVRVFFQRGAFDSTATAMTSQAFIFYSLGLVGASLRLMLNRVFYAFQDTKTPMLNGVLAVGLNVVLNLILIRFMAHSGLALATSISATFTTLLLFLSLRKKIGPIGLRGYLKSFLKTLISSLVMGLVVYFLYFGLTAKFIDSRIGELMVLLLSVILGALVYFILCAILRVKEIKILVKGLIKK